MSFSVAAPSRCLAPARGVISRRCIVTSAAAAATVRPSVPHVAITHSMRCRNTVSRDVRVALFGKAAGLFGPSAHAYGAQDTREQFNTDDVDFYFNLMGFLADEGNYDRMHALMEKRHPIDCLLLLAAEANDTPKVKEVLAAGADIRVKDPKGKSASDLASKEETKKVLLAAASGKSYGVDAPIG